MFEEGFARDERETGVRIGVDVLTETGEGAEEKERREDEDEEEEEEEINEELEEPVSKRDEEAR
jgi:hypothetical protein